jgi:hypothetical protein
VDRQGHLRASDADRDRVIERLHGAATEGRIAAEELEERVSLALTARTYRELEAVVADLPGPAAGSGTRRVPRFVTAGRWAFLAIRRQPALGVLLIPLLLAVIALIMAIAVLWTLVVTVVLLAGGRRWLHVSGAPRRPRVVRRGWV